MPIDQYELDRLEDRLRKRGFRRDDVLMHDCESCNEHAVATYVISGRGGGRDISLCLACGKARSWRSGSGLESRVEDANFDLETFLR